MKRVELATDLETNPDRKRRTHALLGQSILRQVSSVRVTKVEFYVDPSKYPLETCDNLRRETASLTQQIKSPSHLKTGKMMTTSVTTNMRTPALGMMATNLL